MAGVFGEALPKLTPQTAPWDHNTPFLKAKSVASLFPHPSSAYMALSVSKPYNGIKVEGEVKWCGFAMSTKP